jgi:hypothetical protein
MAVAVLSGAGSALLGLCGPSTDVSDVAFCPFVQALFAVATPRRLENSDPAIERASWISGDLR